jgi:hypothetical protein
MNFDDDDDRFDQNFHRVDNRNRAETEFRRVDDNFEQSKFSSTDI